MTSGIYKIINSLTKDFYVGSSFNIEARFSAHMSDLRKQKHANPRLQNAFNKYGEAAFYVYVVEILDRDAGVLAQREQLWLDEVVGAEDCYNISKYVGSPMRGRKASVETRAKMSKAKIGNQSSKGRPAWNKGKKLSKEESAKLSASRKGNKNCVGRVLSEETRKKISESLKRRHAR